MSKEFIIDQVSHGYNQDTIYGRYVDTDEDPVTVEDVKTRFCSGYFGGTNANINPVNKTFSVIIFGND